MKNFVAAAIISTAVFATGAAALVYQVVFERYLARLVGSDHVATGLTLATFLGGLALGYWLCGRLTLAVRNHLLGYAGLEALIGLWALGFPSLFAVIERGVDSWRFAYPWGLALQGLLVACALILPPTLLMGATVPFVTRAAAHVRESVSSAHAATYAINTAGAFAGVLLGGFVLVPLYGLPGVMRGTAVVNLVAALLLVAVAVVRRGGDDAARVAGATARPTIAGPRFSRQTIYAMGVLSGLGVLLLESVTIRLGKLVFGSSTYTFSMIVAVFVLAIAVGSLMVARAPRLPAGVLFALQVVAGGYLLLLFFTIDEWPYWAHMLRTGFQGGTAGFVLFHASALAASTLILIVPVTALGATLPVLFHELDAGVRESGWFSGRLLALNGVGTLLGSLGGSFVLYAFLDLPRIYLLVPVFVLVNALLASRALRSPARITALLLLGLSLVTLVLRPAHDPDRLAFGLFRIRQPLPFSGYGARLFHEEYFRGSTVVARDDDPVASVAVIEWPRSTPEGETTSRSIVVNGRSDSDTLLDTETIKLAAHIPALWAPSRERMLVVGLGTGVTAGELSLYEDAGSIDVAEISPSVIEFLPLFAADTSSVHADPRLKVELGDALLTLRRARESWDLIASEPSNPWVAGADTLFTREFYRLVRSRLSPGGVFLQWIQLYDNNYEMLGIMLNTLRSEFPVLHAFRGSSGDLLVLASTRPFTAEDSRRARDVLAAHPRVAASLSELGIHSVEDLLGREIGSLPVILRQTTRHGINTMDRPRLHYLAGRAMFSGSIVTEEMLRYGVTRVDFLFDERFRTRHEPTQQQPPPEPRPAP